MLERPSKWLKQVIQIKHNRVKNPNWRETNQLAINIFYIFKINGSQSDKDERIKAAQYLQQLEVSANNKSLRGFINNEVTWLLKVIPQ